MRVDPTSCRVSACLGVAAGAVILACNWTQLDAIALSGAGSASGGPGDPDGAAPPDASAPDSEPSSAACTSSVTSVREWTFDSSVQGWSLSTDLGVEATLTWNDSLGDPSPGALEVSVTPDATDAGALTGTWAAFDMPSSPADLSHRTIAAWVRLESGAPPHLKTMVQTGSQYVWADNGTVYLVPGIWTCVWLAPSTPAYSQPNYDPTDVVRFGFEMLSSTPFVVSIDDVRYY